MAGVSLPISTSLQCSTNPAKKPFEFITKCFHSCSDRLCPIPASEPAAKEQPCLQEVSVGCGDKQRLNRPSHHQFEGIHKKQPRVLPQPSAKSGLNHLPAVPVFSSQGKSVFAGNVTSTLSAETNLEGCLNVTQGETPWCPFSSAELSTLVAVAQSPWLKQTVSEYYRLSLIS